jgi:nucleoside-diphosphate kinase
MPYEKSLVIIKPDGVQRRLIGRILQRFEDTGLKLHACKLVQGTPEMSKRHYAEHVSKGFYPILEQYITSGPVLVFVLGGYDAIKKIRAMVGPTVPADAPPGTIRGDFAHQILEKTGPGRDKVLYNLIHASAKPEEAAIEIPVWFGSHEVLDYPIAGDTFHGL